MEPEHGGAGRIHKDTRLALARIAFTGFRGPEYCFQVTRGFR
jgi:hypothetical protein